MTHLKESHLFSPHCLRSKCSRTSRKKYRTTRRSFRIRDARKMGRGQKKDEGKMGREQKGRGRGEGEGEGKEGKRSIPSPPPPPARTGTLATQAKSPRFLNKITGLSFLTVNRSLLQLIKCLLRK